MQIMLQMAFHFGAIELLQASLYGIITFMIVAHGFPFRLWLIRPSNRSLPSGDFLFSSLPLLCTVEKEAKDLWNKARYKFSSLEAVTFDENWFNSLIDA